MIPNAHLILELMEIVLKGAVMKFQKEFFMQIMGIVMGTNLAPILANIYMAMLELHSCLKFLQWDSSKFCSFFPVWKLARANIPLHEQATDVCTCKAVPSHEQRKCCTCKLHVQRTWLHMQAEKFARAKSSATCPEKNYSFELRFHGKNTNIEKILKQFQCNDLAPDTWKLCLRSLYVSILHVQTYIYAKNIWNRSDAALAVNVQT